MMEGEITREQVDAVIAAIYRRLDVIDSVKDIGSAFQIEPLLQILKDNGWDVKDA